MRSRTSLCMLLALTLLASATSPVASAAMHDGSDAAVSGVVRDAHGTPQMGALVQLLSADASIIATAFTDNHGRYIMPTVNPGKYELRASAAFFMPASRSNVRLQAGAQAIINLTMSTLYEAANWLPAQPRRAGEPVDDWKWTLRSSANRPLLRLADDDDVVDSDGTIQVSSSAEHQHRATTKTRVSVTSGDGGYGEGGVHQVLIVDRAVEDGDGAIFRADLGGVRVPFQVAPAAEGTAGYQRRSPLGGSTRLVVSMQSHPEFTDGTSAGMQVLRLASTQEFKFGDFMVLDAGALSKAQRLQGTRLSTEPFVRLLIRPGDGVLVEYRYAAGRELQSSEDLDHLKPALNTLSDGLGHPLSTKGSHHELSVSGKFRKSVVQVSGFTDELDNTGIMGRGVLDHDALAGLGVLADPTTGTFAVASEAYSGRGLGASLVHALTPSLSAAVTYDVGTALVNETGDVLPLAGVTSGMSPRMSYAVSGSLRGRILKTGTTVRAGYRWQPEHTLTAVNAFNASEHDAYLGIYLRQRVWCGKLLPEGIDAVIEGTNLMAQGYQPVVAPDGRIFVLAQAPRSIQGGFAFNF